MDAETRKRDKEQKARVNEAKRERKRMLETDTKVEVVVRNHDFVNQGVPIEFTYLGKQFKIGDGEKVKLPACVIDHLNSLTVPDPVYVQDDETGQIKLQSNRSRSRFTATPTGPISRVGKPNGKEAGKQ
jgi:hypothetical protein